MTIGYVQTALAFQVSTDGPLPITLNAGAGHLLAVWVYCPQEGRTISASDGQGSYAVGVDWDLFSLGSIRLLYLKNCNSGTHSIQVTTDNPIGQTLYVAACEWSGADTVSPIFSQGQHQQQVFPGSSAGAVNSGSAYNGGDSSDLIVGISMMLEPPINQSLTAYSSNQRFQGTWGGFGVGNNNICISDQTPTGSDISKFTSSLGTETDLTLSFSLAPQTTHATISSTDGHDASAVAGRVTTGAAVAATDHPDLVVAAGSVITTASVAATDAADRALAYTSLGTLASIAATDQADVIAVGTSLLAVPAGRSRHKRGVWVDGRMHYEKGDEPTPPPQGTPQERQRRAMLEWVEKRAQADARRITNKGMK